MIKEDQSPSLLLTDQGEKVEPENKTEGMARKIERNPEMCCSERQRELL